MNQNHASSTCVSINQRWPKTRHVMAARRGMTFIELLATMITSSILLTGLTASILMSNKALQVTSAQQQGTSQQRQSIEQLRVDLREATKFETPDANTLSLTVPDRSGDAVPDVVTYNFPTDGSASVSRTASSVTTPYSMGTLTRTTRPTYFVPAAPITPPTPILRVSGYASALSTSSTTSLTIPPVPNTLAGDMLVLVLASDSSSGTLTLSSGTWTNLINRTNSPLQLRVWWRNATADETDSLTLTNSTSIRMSAALLRITDSNGTIVAHTSTTVGTSTTPTSNSCATTSNNMLLFRVLCARDDSYIPDYTGLSNNLSVMMRAGDTSSSAVTLGIGYRKIPTPTSSTATNFRLTASEAFISGSFAVGASAN